MLERGRTRAKRAARRVEPDAAETLCASGASVHPDLRAAVTASLQQALAAFEGRAPALGFVFATPGHDLASALATARALAADTDFVGCSTAGELTERGLTHAGVAALLVSWGHASHVLEVAPKMGSDALELSRRLCDGFADRARQHAAAGRPHSITVVLGDGLSPAFEKLVVQLRRTTSDTQQIVGAGAADEGALARTQVGANGRAFQGGALALHVFSKSRWGIGVEHGVAATTVPMTGTRAQGNLVREIDGTPALEVYRRYAAGRGQPLEDAGLAQFLIENELGVLLFEDIVRIRAPIRVEPDGSLFFAGEVPEGARVCIVRGEPEQMLAAAKRAAESAAEGLAGARAAGVLVFSCICRGLRLGARYADEIECVRKVFPDVPIAGFSSYGEIARTAAKLEGYHNSTIVVAAIPE
jgi:hypothetical protein